MATRNRDRRQDHRRADVLEMLRAAGAAVARCLLEAGDARVRDPYVGEARPQGPSVGAGIATSRRGRQCQHLIQPNELLAPASLELETADLGPAMDLRDLDAGLLGRGRDRDSSIAHQHGRPPRG